MIAVALQQNSLKHPLLLVSESLQEIFLKIGFSWEIKKRSGLFARFLSNQNSSRKNSILLAIHKNPRMFVSEVLQKN